MADLDLEEIKKKKFNISVENLITIGMVIVTVTGMWYSLQGDIEEAKKLPEPEVSRTEYDLKDQLIRETIINTQEKVQENGEKLEDIDQKLFEIIKEKKMRLTILALLFSLFSYGQEVTTVHFNYKWNENNTYDRLDRLKDTKVQYAFVEDQSDIIKKSIKSVPTIVIYNNSKPVARFEAGLTMRISVSLDSIQAVINKYKR